MKIPAIKKIEVTIYLLILNFILRNQVFSNEIGSDSFLMHAMVNSLTEYGKANWIMDPLSFFGLYPASYTSSMHFLLSSFSQLSGFEMREIIYLYCLIIGLLSIATSYLMAGEIFDDDLYKFLTAFSFSLSPGVLGYTTWTIPTRGLLIILATLFIFLLMRCRKSLKYVPLTMIFALFLFTTHHLFYFLLPAIFAFIILSFVYIFHDKTRIISKYISVEMRPVATIAFFCLMFAIPFFTGKFVEMSRYSPVYINYFRYIGIMSIPAIGAFFYLVFKKDKNFSEWYLISCLALLTLFIYEQTYMKWFLPIFVIPLAGLGLINILNSSNNQRNVPKAFIALILFSVIFSGYFQFLHSYEENAYNERYLEDSVLVTGSWMKDHLAAASISNDVHYGDRIFSVSETSYLLTDSMLLNNVYGFYSVNVSEFERYPITSESFWFSGYAGKDYGLVKWERVQKMWESDDRIKYFIENTRANGLIVWNHKIIPSPLLEYAYSQNLIYDNGVSNIWILPPWEA